MTVEETIKKIVCKNYSIDVVGNKTKFVEDLGADSLSVLEMMMDVEDAFDISIPENDIRDESFKTVGDLINYIKEKTKQQVKIKIIMHKKRVVN